MSPSVGLLAYDTVDEVAKRLRTYVIDSQNSAYGRHDTFRIAVSGGSLPKVLAQALLNPEAKELGLDFSKWHIFFADERAVPLDHEDSNYRLVKEELLDRIPKELGTPTVYPIDTSLLDDLPELADAYEQAIVKVFAARDSVRLPMFDLLLLGCGPDGHTCSLFPGSPLLKETEAWVLHISDSPKPPPKRITLSLPVASHGINIAFVATGAGKKEIMKQIFDLEEGKKLPCAQINHIAGERVVWFTDTPAVEGVEYPRRGLSGSL